MLILVGVTISVELNGGLFGKAREGASGTQIELDKEILASAALGTMGENGEVNFEELDANLPDGFEGNNGDYTSKAGNEFNVDRNGNIKKSDYKPASELFDANAEKLSAINSKKDEDFTTDGKLHIGDFINYDAGTWTADEISSIKTGTKDSEVIANKSNTELPTKAFQFGGFAAGDSRNGSAKPKNDNYNYIKDKNGEIITGWRLFDIDENSIILISAGCPEDFFVPDKSDYNNKGGYISEYILSGNENSYASSLSYTKRNWENYVNGTQHADSANPITKKDLDDWYSKYTGINNSDTFTRGTFQKIYKTRYENLIDNYSFYWLASAANHATFSAVCNVYPSEDGSVFYNWAVPYGIRILVTLPSNTMLTKSGEKTVANIANDSNRSDKPYTYNVWNIK